MNQEVLYHELGSLIMQSDGVENTNTYASFSNRRRNIFNAFVGYWAYINFISRREINTNGSICFNNAHQCNVDTD
jgi:hypothetical protein